jgi:hypothetical protein
MPAFGLSEVPTSSAGPQSKTHVHTVVAKIQSLSTTLASIAKNGHAQTVEYIFVDIGFQITTHHSIASFSRIG